ncbi:uncharacterized protein LOC142178183 [Nicotiana tabacum]|uniref:Uncharacterized protein LOC142178183 n=1 Tax=Nicotiana tabacum TaxID=4097 RepID=A0AC58U297_TOBAC
MVVPSGRGAAPLVVRGRGRGRGRATTPAKGQESHKVAPVVPLVELAEDPVIEDQDEVPAAEPALADFVTASEFQDVMGLRIETYAKSYNVKVWRVIKKWNYPLSAAAQPPTDPEDIDDYTNEQIAVVQVNATTRNLLYNAISGKEYEKISSCDTAKEMWDKLKVMYEGTSKIKEGESIEKIFARFSKIISDLKAFGKPYSNGDQVRKIPRSLPTTWQTKDILDLTLKESQKKMNGLRRLNREKKDWELMLEVCEIERDVLQDEVQELQMQLNGMRKSTSQSSVKSSTSQLEKDRLELSPQDGFGNPKTILILVELTNKDPSKLGYLKESDNSVLQEHHRKSRKGKWYLDSACSSYMTSDKNLFKEVTKINGGSVKFGDDSKGNIVGTGTVPFNNNCDITEVYLVKGLNYNLLSIIHLCDSGYEVKFKKTGCAIEDETGKIILPGKRYENVYILDGIENLDSHICLASISDDPWLWHKKLGHASMHLIEKLSKHDLVIGLPKLNFSRNHVCDACQIGKQIRNSFKSKDIVSTTKPL